MPKTTLIPVVPNKTNEKAKTDSAITNKNIIDSFDSLFSKLIHPYIIFIVY